MSGQSRSPSILANGVAYSASNFILLVGLSRSMEPAGFGSLAASLAAGILVMTVFHASVVESLIAHRASYVQVPAEVLLRYSLGAVSLVVVVGATTVDDLSLVVPIAVSAVALPAHDLVRTQSVFVLRGMRTVAPEAAWVGLVGVGGALGADEIGLLWTWTAGLFASLALYLVLAKGNVRRVRGAFGAPSLVAEGLIGGGLPHLVAVAAVPVMGGAAAGTVRLAQTGLGPMATLGGFARLAAVGGAARFSFRLVAASFAIGIVYTSALAALLWASGLLGEATSSVLRVLPFFAVARSSSLVSSSIAGSIRTKPEASRTLLELRVLGVVALAVVPLAAGWLDGPGGFGLALAAGGLAVMWASLKRIREIQ